MSPDKWAGESYTPFEDLAPLVSARGDNKAPMPPWLTALPHPAALIHHDNGKPCFEHRNQLFVKNFHSVSAPPACETLEFSQIEVELKNFVASGHEVVRFDLERQGVLGIEAFACSLAWVKAPLEVDCRILLSAIDRTADRRIEESLRRELVSDTLTALPNRTGFGEAVEEMLAQKATHVGKQASIIIIDLKRFSRINEALGTMAGDELILAVAARLKTCMSAGVVLARLGGNEFGICHLVEKDSLDSLILAEKARSAITAPIRLSNLEISINCAVGCAVVDLEEAESDELIRQAQTAARLAKKSDRLELYKAGELKVARQRFFLESHLRDALANEELSLVYQPIIDLTSSQVIGFEALARWHDKELGAISPAEFIPVAEESGLVVELGRWALHEAARQLSRWDGQLGAHMPVKLNVNLSPIQMARDDVIATIGSALDKSGVDGKRLMIELTESAIVGDPDACRDLLAALKKSNIAIAMDDFGTGYSNMASLQSLPIDILKIDRTFVSDMLIDTDKMAIIRAILSLTDALNMKATAEGIEDAEVADALREMGCAYGQGYYFARPMSAAAAFDYWLASWKSAAS